MSVLVHVGAPPSPKELHRRADEALEVVSDLHSKLNTLFKDLKGLKERESELEREIATLESSTPYLTDRERREHKVNTETTRAELRVIQQEIRDIEAALEPAWATETARVEKLLGNTSSIELQTANAKLQTDLRACESEKETLNKEMKAIQSREAEIERQRRPPQTQWPQPPQQRVRPPWKEPPGPWMDGQIHDGMEYNAQWNKWNRA